MIYNLLKLEKWVLNRYYKLHVKRMLGINTLLFSHHYVVREYIKNTML